MTWIEASCPSCGPVEVTPDDIELGVCTNNAAASYYSFRCPLCSGQVRKKAEDRVIELLTSEGVRPTAWSVPAEALEERSGPPINTDDVLDLLLALDDPNWFDSFVEQAR